MINTEEKEKIKKEIVEKINSVLEKKDESFRLDKVNVLNTKETVKFMGNYRVYDRRKYDSVSREINSFLKQYGDVEIKSKKIRDSGMKFTAVSFNFEL
jgi:myo-inositol-1-phosphate synthase